jgi:cysteine synthase A
MKKAEVGVGVDASVGGRVAESVLELVGSTPLLRLSRYAPAGAADIYAKLEFLNPGGSVKDRAALGMILEAERKGLLRHGSTIVEPTAGNTGIGLALIGIARGYRVVLVVPEKFVGPKTSVMHILGAEVVLTPTEKGMPFAIERARELGRSIENAYVPQQFENEANPDYHYQTTAAEVFAQLGGVPDAIVLGAGTGGTFSGLARFFRERGDVRCVLVEPQGSVWGGGAPGPHKVEGIGNSFWPGTLHRDLVDEVLTVDDETSFTAVRELARQEGLLVGGSSGSAAHAAREVAKRLGPGRRVVTLFPDGFERYLGKGVFENL